MSTKALEDQLDRTRWHRPEIYFDLLEERRGGWFGHRQSYEEFIESTCHTLEQNNFLSELSDDCVKVGLRLYGLGEFSEDAKNDYEYLSFSERKRHFASERFINNHSGTILLYNMGCFDENMKHLQAGESLAVCNVKNSGHDNEDTVEKVLQRNDFLRNHNICRLKIKLKDEDLYLIDSGDIMRVKPNQSARIVVRNTNAIFMLIYGMNKEDTARMKKMEDYNANKRYALSESYWKSIDDYYEDDDGATKAREILLRPLIAMGCITERGLRKYTMIRILQSPRGTVFGEPPYTAHMFCPHAVDKNGVRLKKGEHAMSIIMLKSFFTMDLNVGDTTVISSEVGPVSYVLADNILVATITRTPVLDADIKDGHSLLKDQSDDKPITMPLASRKERTCDGCGIVWRSQMNKCSRCKCMNYCSKVCQVGHWREAHKLTCNSQAKKKS